MKITWNEVKIDELINKYGEKIISKAANIVLDEQIANCPVDTGNLVSSLHIEDNGPNSKLVGSSGVEYVTYIEFGTRKMPAQPFIRNSIIGFRI